MKSAIIIGKGPSLNKCESSYASQFDDLIICNYLKFSGYESIVPYRANIQFRGKGAKNYEEEEFLKLGISDVIGIQPNQKDYPFESHYNHANLYYLNHEITKDKLNRDVWKISVNNFSLVDPSCGTLALDWACKSGLYKKISICGFDLFKKGTKAYYWKRDDWPENLRYLIDTPGHVYDRSGTIVKDHLHNEKEAADYIYKLMEYYQEINFEFLSDNQYLNQLLNQLNNVKRVFK